jgi:hypothetical protein
MHYTWIVRDTGPPSDIIETAGRMLANSFTAKETYKATWLEHLQYCICAENKMSGVRLYGFFGWNTDQLPKALIPAFSPLWPIEVFRSTRPTEKKRKSLPEESLGKKKRKKSDE